MLAALLCNGVAPAPLVGVRRSRRPWLRLIENGYGTTAGVETRGEVGTAKAHGRAPEPEKRVGVAVTDGRSLFSEVGVVKGKGVGKAKAGELRAMRGALGKITPHSGARAETKGYELQGEYGQARAYGGAAAFTAAHASLSEIGQVKGSGITNPTSAEMLALVVALRRRRRH